MSALAKIKANWKYYAGGGTVLLVVLGILYYLYHRINFSNIKIGFTTFDATAKKEGGDQRFPMRPGRNATDPEELVDNTRPERQAGVARAIAFYEFAVRDYYNGNFDEALRRLDRAKMHNPANYNVFRLSGQIQFERGQYRKAFNEWMRAVQLPNDDRTMERDLDVVKRLIRYSRNEIDRLQHFINLHPGDRVAEAKLRELEEQMNE